MKDKKIRHRVILYVEKDCEERYMTEKQMKGWVEHHFAGCDYGKVRVADVLNEEVKPK